MCGEGKSRGGVVLYMRQDEIRLSPFACIHTQPPWKIDAITPL